MGHQMLWMREDGVGRTVCEVMVHRPLYVVGAGKRCRVHRLRGTGVQVTKCRRHGETV